MSKIKLNPDPTFTAPVPINRHGLGAVDVKFTFKHRTKDGLAEWVKSVTEKTDIEAIMDCTVGWELDDEYSSENIAILLQNYFDAGPAIVTAYINELMAARTKN